MVNPLPVQMIVDFARQVGQVYVIEELDDIIETHCLKNGIPVIGKLLFPTCGEFSQATVREALLGEELPHVVYDGDVPARPPVLCAGCPHRGLFYALKKYNPVSYTHLDVYKRQTDEGRGLPGISGYPLHLISLTRLMPRSTASPQGEALVCRKIEGCFRAFPLR